MTDVLDVSITKELPKVEAPALEVATIRGSGRRIKFTPERIEQIRNLIERGMTREEIADMIDVTVGSLQVTCSRLGISLRRPRDVAPAARRPPPPTGDGNGKRADASVPLTDETRLALILRHRGREKVIELRLPLDVVTQIAVEATFRNLTIADVIAEAIVAGMRGRK